MIGKAEEKTFFMEILQKEFQVRGQSTEEGAVREALALLAACEKLTEAREVLKRTIEKISNGKNTVVFDDGGYPSVMVRIPMMRCREVLSSSDSAAVHPAFRYGEKVVKEILVSKYINCVADGRAHSLPMAVPYVAAGFDEAARLCYRKGKGWMPLPHTLRMAIALDIRKKGEYPGGNSDSGVYYFDRSETGELTGEGGTVFTGSGPANWSHDRTVDGIYDMHGNLNEWEAGYRLVDGELQYVDLPELMVQSSLDSESSAWYAMNEKGEKVLPGSDGTMHFDVKDGKIRLTTEKKYDGIGNCSYSEITAREGLKVPEELILRGAYPEKGSKLVNIEGWRWVSTEGEVMPICGGAYRILDHGGVFFTGMTKPRKSEYGLCGMRCAYIAPESIMDA